MVNPLAWLLPEPPGPTPWATGLVVAAFVAVFVTLADVVLCRAFAEAGTVRVVGEEGRGSTVPAKQFICRAVD